MNTVNKKLLIIFSILIIVLVVTIPILSIFFSSKDIGSYLHTLVLSKYDFINQKNSYTVPRNILNEEMRMFRQSSEKSDTMIQKAFENKVVNDTIILIKAVNEKVFNENEFKRYIFYVIRTAIIDYYIKTHYHREYKKTLNTQITHTEVAALYQKYKNVYSNLTMTEKQAHGLIAKVLLQKKREQAYVQYMHKLVNRFKLDNSIQIGK